MISNNQKYQSILILILLQKNPIENRINFSLRPPILPVPPIAPIPPLPRISPIPRVPPIPPLPGIPPIRRVPPIPRVAPIRLVHVTRYFRHQVFIIRFVTDVDTTL